MGSYPWICLNRSLAHQEAGRGEFYHREPSPWLCIPVVLLTWVSPEHLLHCRRIPAPLWMEEQTGGFRSGTVLAVHVGLGDGVGSQARPPRGVCARRRSSSAVWKRRWMVTGGSSHRGASRAPWEAALRGWRSCCSVGSPRGCGRGSGVAPLSRCLFLCGSGSAAPAGSVLPRPCPSLGGPAASEK